MCLSFVFTLGRVNAKEQDTKYKASGSFVSSVIDTNGDGIPGVTGLLQGQSTFGAVTIHFFSEFDMSGMIDPMPSANCPDDGLIELPLVDSRTIHSYKNGDLIYFATIEEIFCADPITGQFHWTESLYVIGGTGRFEGAEGTMQVSGSGNMLISGIDGATNFGGVSLSGKANIRLLKNE